MTVKEWAWKNLLGFRGASMIENVPFCLMDGTLLGAYRDKDFCEGDADDVDLGIMDDVYDRAAKLLIPRMVEGGFEHFKTFTHKGRIEGLGLRRGPSHIDMIRINTHHVRNECYNLGTGPDGNVLAFVYPRKHHSKFELLEWNSIFFHIPWDVEGFLTARYGDWQTPIPRSKFCWWEDANPESIRKDYDRI